jgi:hypothetical protein
MGRRKGAKKRKSDLTEWRAMCDALPVGAQVQAREGRAQKQSSGWWSFESGGDSVVSPYPERPISILEG